MVRSLAGAKAIADTTLTIPHPYPPGAAEAWIADVQLGWEAGTMATFAITRAGDDGLLGVVGLTIERPHARAELGYWIGEPFWGNGYATEAARVLCAYGFNALGLHRIHAHHFTRNPASGRVMEKLGMTREGLLRHAVRKGDGFEDLAIYSVLASEWISTAS